MRLARAEDKAGRPELARTRIDGSLRDYPWISELWLMKAELLDHENDLAAALVARREAQRLTPGRPEAENALAWTLARAGSDLPEAEQHALAAIERLGRVPTLLDTLALVHVAQQRYGAALALADEGLASAKEGDRVDLLFRRAEALAGLGRRDDAEQALAAARVAAATTTSPWNTWGEAELRVKQLLDGPA
jgi:tetratricopeptide (TPR) repeat protein